jgi:hypothetical protein
MIAERFIIPGNPAPTPYVGSSHPQVFFPIDITGPQPQPTPTDPLPVADLYDLIVGAGTSPPPTYYYHAVLEDDGEITVVRDIFGQAFPHTFFGWLIPGIPMIGQPIATIRHVPGLKLPKKWKQR